MTRNKFTQKGATATPQTDNGALSPEFRQPIETNRRDIQKQIAQLRASMGLRENPAADARLAKAEPEDFPSGTFTPRLV